MNKLALMRSKDPNYYFWVININKDKYWVVAYRRRPHLSWEALIPDNEKHEIEKMQAISGPVTLEIL